MKKMHASLEEWLAGLCMLGVMGLGGWQVSLAVQHPDILDIPLTLESVRSGESTDQFSKILDNNLPWRDELIAWANSGRYLLTQGAGDQVRVGRDEWLFSVEEIEYFSQYATHQTQRLQQVRRISEELRKSNVILLMALVPDKARVHAEHLRSGKYPDWYQDRYLSILTELRRFNIAVVDLYANLAGRAETYPTYYTTDTHWNQTGARVAAHSIADQVAELGVTSSTTNFRTKTSAIERERVGDLLKIMGLERVPNWMRPNPDKEFADATESLEPAANTSLFGNIHVPVTLVGTSYSLRANFHGYLQEYLQATILNVAMDGGGFIQSMGRYLRDDSFKVSPPSLVIWEIPERVFSAPILDAELKAFPFTIPQ
jgi:alginate O-acetyltransferase complex protein AlgJ